MSESNIKKIERDENGLIANFTYYINDQGLIDWRKMIPIEFLYINPDNKRRSKLEEKYGKKYDEIDIIEDNVVDQDLVIMLGGLKNLLRVRGYSKITYKIHDASESYAAVNCKINFIGNYETEMRDIQYSENACAHTGNTMSFAKNYLLEIATNRSLARCIRNFLNINIVSKEELSASLLEEEQRPLTSSVTTSPIELLAKKLNERNIDLDFIRKTYPQFKSEWKELKDIETQDIFSILGWINANRVYGNKN